MELQQSEELRALQILAKFELRPEGSVSVSIWECHMLGPGSSADDLESTGDDGMK